MKMQGFKATTNIQGLESCQVILVDQDLNIWGTIDRTKAKNTARRLRRVVKSKRWRDWRRARVDLFTVKDWSSIEPPSFVRCFIVYPGAHKWKPTERDVWA
jgi:hypothetical protein